MYTAREFQAGSLKKPGKQCRIKNSFPQQYASNIALDPRELYKKNNTLVHVFSFQL